MRYFFFFAVSFALCSSNMQSKESRSFFTMQLHFHIFQRFFIIFSALEASSKYKDLFYYTSLFQLFLLRHIANNKNEAPRFFYLSAPGFSCFAFNKINPYNLSIFPPIISFIFSCTFSLSQFHQQIDCNFSIVLSLNRFLIGFAGTPPTIV